LVRDCSSSCKTIAIVFVCRLNLTSTTMRCVRTVANMESGCPDPGTYKTLEGDKRVAGLDAHINKHRSNKMVLLDISCGTGSWNQQICGLCSLGQRLAAGRVVSK
jgi:hypothetical protein